MALFLRRLKQDQQQHLQHLSNLPLILIHTLTFTHTHFHPITSCHYLSFQLILAAPEGKAPAHANETEMVCPGRHIQGKGKRQEGEDQARAGICHAPRVARTNLVAWVWVVLGEALSWPFLRAACV